MGADELKVAMLATNVTLATTKNTYDRCLMMLSGVVTGPAKKLKRGDSLCQNSVFCASVCVIGCVCVVDWLCVFDCDCLCLSLVMSVGLCVLSVCLVSGC